MMREWPHVKKGSRARILECADAALVDRTGRLGVAPLAYNPAKDLAGEPIVSGLPNPYSRGVR